MPRLTGSTNNGSYLYVDYTVGAQDVAGNWTDISWTAGVHWGTYYFNIHDAQVNFGATGGVGGSTGTGVYNSGWPVSGAASNKDYPFSSGTLRAYHDSNGNCTVTATGSAWWDTPSNFTSNLSSSFVLPQIPRYPSAPGTPSVTGHNDSDPTTATISWTAPTDVGAGLTQRQIQMSTNSSFSTTVLDNTAAWGTSVNVTTMAKNTTYYVRVRASSSAGWGPYSSVQSFTTGTTAPGAPSTPSAGTKTYTTIDVSWSAPADNGGTAITSYTVERATNSGFTSGVQSYTGIAGTSYTITGLTASTSYWVRVKAINATGTSPNSSALATATQTATAPNAPAAPTFSGVGGTSLTVNWGAPATNGAAITGYTLQMSTTSGTTGFSDRITGIAASATSANVTGLNYGQNYWFRLIANSSAGNTTGASAAVTMGSTTPFAPAAPTIGNILQITATVSFAAPSDGGSAITGYDIQRATDSGFTQNVVTTAASGSPLDITGLDPAIQTWVRVRAINANGNGAWSPATSFTPLGSAYVYKGSTWVGCQIYVWKSNQWVLCTTQKWSGTAWV